MFSGILQNFILILDNFKKMLFYILFLNYFILYLCMPLKERVFLTH